MSARHQASALGQYVHATFE